jgi:hypothetical protein
VLGVEVQRERAANAEMRRDWWDSGDEPPEALVAGLEKVVKGVRRLVPEAGAPESPRARNVRLAVLSVIFIALVWLVLAAILAQV